jgi:hypothetical protein
MEVYIAPFLLIAIVLGNFEFASIQGEHSNFERYDSIKKNFLGDRTILINFFK